MKTFTFIALAAVTVFTVASCGVLGKSSGSASATEQTSVTTSAATDGHAAGVALKSLYGQYKTDGKLDMSNLTNIVNLASLAQNIKGLKGLQDKSVFYKEFASGLILGSDNLVTQQTSSSVMSGLSGLANNIDLSSLQAKASQFAGDVTEKAESAAATTSTVVSNASSIADSITNILNLFKK